MQTETTETKASKSTPPPANAPAAAPTPAEAKASLTDNLLAAQPASVSSTHLGLIQLSDITESKTNPRTDWGDLEGLAASIKRDGVLNPVLVRKMDGSTKFELLAGARRLRAAKLAQQGKIPAIRVICSDEEAVEIQMVENTQRADISPLDEAQGYQALADRLKSKYGHPVLEIAKRVGKSPLHITKRLQLIGLPKIARDALAAKVITLQSAELIARVPGEKLREEAAKDVLQDVEISISNGWQDNIKKQAPTTEVIKKRLEQNYMCRLDKASFDKTDAKLVAAAGACGPCPKRTGNQGDLFSDVGGKEVCTDPTCFKSKQDADWANKAKVAAAKGAKVLTSEASEDVFHDDGRVHYGSGYCKPTDEISAGSAYGKAATLVGKDKPKVVVARGPNGNVVELWVRKDVEEIVSKRKKKVSPSAQNDRKKAAAEKARQELCRAVQIRTLTEGLARVSTLSERDFLAFAADMASDMVEALPKTFLKATGFAKPKELFAKAPVKTLRQALLTSLIGEPGVLYNSDKNVQELAKVMKVDINKVRATVKAELEQQQKAAADKKGARK